LYKVRFNGTPPLAETVFGLLGSVQSTTALARATQANDFVLFNRELVIIRDFFPNTDRLFGIDHNFFLAFDRDDSGIAIWLVNDTISLKKLKSK
jgi:hypothetical protein